MRMRGDELMLKGISVTLPETESSELIYLQRR
jgi:hypothetical protein